MIEKYTEFSSIKEKLNFMKKYGLASKTMFTIPKLYHKFTNSSTYQKCDLLGYLEEHDTFCIMVIDYGAGPVAIHSDFFLDMQNMERNKGKSLKEYTDSYVVFDFETTGTNIKEAEIIQIGAIKIKSGKEIGIFNEYVRPENPIPSKITNLTGITDLDVCMADNIENVLKKFLSFIDNYTLVGFNIGSFDTTLLYDHAKHLYGIDVSNNYIDLRYIAEAYFKNNKIDIPNCKLTTIAEYFGIDINNVHQALSDCYITNECYKKIFRQTLSQNPPVVSRINIINNKFEQKVFDILQEIILSEALPENSLYLYSSISRGNKSGAKPGDEISKLICVHEPDYPLKSHNVDRIGKNDTFLQIIYTKDGKIKLHIRDAYLVSLDVPPSAQVKKIKSDTLFTNIVFLEDDVSIYEFIRSAIMHGLENYESNSSFSCCSQFRKCSDELKCVHENKLYAKGCKYRSNLESGKIFYGKNRNIDI